MVALRDLDGGEGVFFQGLVCSFSCVLCILVVSGVTFMAWGIFVFVLRLSVLVVVLVAEEVVGEQLVSVFLVTKMYTAIKTIVKP